MHLYSDYCVLLHTKALYNHVGGGGDLFLNHHQCAASTWRMRRLPQDNGTSALATHRLQVQRRESHRANQVYALTTTSYRWRRESHRANQVDALTTHKFTGGEERGIEPIKWMHPPHTSYRWRGERHRANQVDAPTTHK